MDAKPGENERPVLFLLINGQKINGKAAKILCSYIGNHMAPCQKDISPLEKSVNMKPEIGQSRGQARKMLAAV